MKTKYKIELTAEGFVVQRRRLFWFITLAVFPTYVGAYQWLTWRFKGAV
jgi:hypothetical protein